jgi:hypothetical protein
MVIKGMSQGMPDSQTCQVKNNIDSLHCTCNIEGIGDILAEELEVLLSQVMGEIFKFAVGEIVDYTNRAALFHKGIHKV